MLTLIIIASIVCLAIGCSRLRRDRLSDRIAPEVPVLVAPGPRRWSRCWRAVGRGLADYGDGYDAAHREPGRNAYIDMIKTDYGREQYERRNRR